MILQVGTDMYSSSSWGNRKLQLRSESGPCDSFQMMATSTTTRLCFQNGGRLLGRLMTNEALAGFDHVEHVVDYFTMPGLISEGQMVNREWAIAGNVVAVGLRYIWVSDLEPFRPADECFAAGPILGRRCQQAHGRVKCDLGRSGDTYVMKDQRPTQVVTCCDMIWSRHLVMLAECPLFVDCRNMVHRLKSFSLLASASMRPQEAKAYYEKALKILPNNRRFSQRQVKRSLPPKWPKHKAEWALYHYIIISL